MRGIFIRKDDVQTWQRLASELGMTFKPGVEAFTGNADSLGYIILGRHLGAKDIHSFIKLLETPFWKKMISQMFIGIISGKYQDYDFYIYRSTQKSGSNHSVELMNIFLPFKKRYDYDMKIKRADFFTNFGKKLFKKFFVNVPHNPILEKLISVSGKKKEQIKVFLSDTRLQSALIELFQGRDNFFIEDYGIKWNETAKFIDKDKALSIMDRMVKAANHFY
jgi:hypothetical protein